jgi:alpha,alpha-trehalose phosphorylase
MDDFTWQIIQEGFNASRERYKESIFAIANGYMGIRATSDVPIPAAQPDLLIAGVYDSKASGLPYSEPQFLIEPSSRSPEDEIVPFPSPFLFEIELGGHNLSNLHRKDHKRILNLKEATYKEVNTFEDNLGRRAMLETTKCASLDDPHILLQKISIRSENFSSPTKIRFSSENKFSALYPHIKIQTIADELCPLNFSYLTHCSKINCIIISKFFLENLDCKSANINFLLELGKNVDIYQIACVFTSNDSHNPFELAKKHMQRLKSDSFTTKLQAHQQKWETFWTRADIQSKQPSIFIRAQRFNSYHLRSAANNKPTSITAKALTGRAYEGHIFWDTEIFMFPFFLYTIPELAKEILLYRYHTLKGAKERAKKLGYVGACYAWESTVSGRDVTPNSITISGTKEKVPLFTGLQQIHVTAGVAYAIYKYWDATLDSDFLRHYGAKILVETARFWNSRVSMVKDSFHILKVVGPDEYHHDVDDNVYTNWMAKFNLEKAIWVCQYLQDQEPDFYQSLAKEITLSDQEITIWQDKVNRLYIPSADANNIIEQFYGYHELSEHHILKEERLHPPVSRLFNWQKTNAAQTIKQADLLMIPFLFSSSLPKKVIAANYDYYEPKTDHGSSLSLCVHAAVAAQIGKFKQAKMYWDKSLNFDLDNLMSNTALGIHAGTMGGAWQALIFHMLGMNFKNQMPVVNKNLTDLNRLGLGAINFKLTYRGKIYPICIGK